MPEAQLGRLLPACLHQAITDVMPARLDYYEEWLSPDGLRDGDIGLAPVTAVLGFLRTEGEAYRTVVWRAGTLAASWSVASLPLLPRRIASSMPVWVRSRVALRVARRIVSDVLSTSVASTRLRRGRATMNVKASLFCSVRERQARPLCQFYAALVVETLRCYLVAAEADVESCRAVDGAQCVVRLRIGGTAQAAEPGQAQAA